jgi:ribonuclease P protein component
MAPGNKESFPKSARLRKRPEFLSLSRSGKKIHSPHFLVIAKPNERAESRLGVTVSGKVGNAVARNRIKRVARESFRRRRKGAAPAKDVLLIARPGAAALSIVLLQQEIEKSLNFIMGRTSGRPEHA